jgi:NAD(P) transhydrogenase subunit beta
MTLFTWINLVYLLAAIGFILALKGLSSPRHARQGNLLGAAAAVLAVAMTFAIPSVRHAGGRLLLIVAAMVIGAAVAVPTARRVKMTAMPQLVAIFNGVGGGAAALVSTTAFLVLTSNEAVRTVVSRSVVYVNGIPTLHVVSVASSAGKPAIYLIVEVILGVVIGCVSFSGSAVAFVKLQELITGRPITYPGQQVINGLVGVAIAGLALATILTANAWLLLGVALLALVLGVIFVLPIGGADVPVLISLLNSFTGLAVAASGFSLGNNLLIIAGTLVGASGILLTRMMSQAMGRSLPNILFSAFGSVVTAAGGADGAGADVRPVRAGTPEDIGVLLAYARKVVIIPGYGLAVAQAQHVARELADSLSERGVDVFYAIHPVAGRMPGHMNVLLAEANVPYDQLKEMDEANAELPTADVALVVGANDTVNPAAKNSPGSPIFGMPIINADQAENVVFLKRSMRPGFAGIDNELLYNPKTTMLFGDAKDTLTKLVAAVNAS